MQHYVLLVTFLPAAKCLKLGRGRGGKRNTTYILLHYIFRVEKLGGIIFQWAARLYWGSLASLFRWADQARLRQPGARVSGRK